MVCEFGIFISAKAPDLVDFGEARLRHSGEGRLTVIPAKAGIHFRSSSFPLPFVIPAKAGTQ
jgi:hypothetical protein